MTTYPVEFHRRLEQKWATRIDQILTVAANATPPRDPNDGDDEEDEEDEERDDEPPVVREPERDDAGNRSRKPTVRADGLQQWQRKN